MIRKLGCKYVSVVESVSESVGLAVSWLAGLLVLVVCYDVFTRYLMQNSLVAVQEMEWHLFALIFLLGSAYTLKHDRHVRVDVFYSRFSSKHKALVNFIGSLLFLVPFCIVGIWGSWTFVKMSFLIGETSPDPGGLPARFILKSAIPIGFFLLMLQGIAFSFKSLAIANGWYDDEEAAT